MSNVPYKIDKSDEGNDDYEIVSFDDFCDKPSGSKTDLLTLNDNINYRLCFESDKTTKFLVNEGETSRNADRLTETSLDTNTKNTNLKEKLGNFSPFGKYTGKTEKGPLFSSIFPRARDETEAEEPRYERFSGRGTLFQRIREYLPSGYIGLFLLTMLIVFCLTWWYIGGAIGTAWAEEHYKRLWERAHPDNTVHKPPSPMPYERVSFKMLPENRYHDHNNLSTKNKNNSELFKKKPDLNKKSVLLDHPDLADTCQNIPENMRFDCYPQYGANEADCNKRGCCWQKNSIEGAPYCYYGSQYALYRFLNMSENSRGMSVYYERIRASGYPDDFETVRMDVIYLSADAVQIKILDAEHSRFEVPYPEIPVRAGYIASPKYRVIVESSAIGFKIIRNEDNVTIVDTQNVGGLILSDKFLQISSLLPTNQLYGLGEKRANFLLNMHYNTITMFNSDAVPTENLNLYGTQPFYMAVERSGKSHGMFLLNSNAMDAVLQPSPAITLRAVGGILSLVVAVGPSPLEVASQYAQLVGLPFMPPYWALGFHLCKFEYGGLNGTERVWQSNREAGIPFDVQWNDIDYMDHRNDFTYDKVAFKHLPDFVKRVHEAGMHYVVILDPGIGVPTSPNTYPPYDRGVEMDVFVKNSTNQLLVGKVWNPSYTVFPDFTHPNATPYWTEMMRDLHKQVPYDGIWIDMNEPSNFVDGTATGSCSPLELPYTPLALRRAGLAHKTLCMDGKHYLGPHYDLHNLYALTEAIATNFALMEIRGKRPFIISRANFAGLGRYAGHWSGDITSDWHSLAMSIPELLNFNLAGIPMMGADICGFGGNTTVALCKRWMQVGAFYPFSRNHNADSSMPQDPVSLGAEVVEASRDALRVRYRLLPYLYSLFWKAHVHGHPVVRPLLMEYPEDINTHAIDQQFLIGPHVMIAPILVEDAKTTNVYLPGTEPWYDYFEATPMGNGYKDIDEHHYILLRSGAIIPSQEVPPRGPVTTSLTRSSPLHLLVVSNSTGQAYGDIYWDDGDSLNSYEEQKYSHIVFKQTGKKITSDITNWGYGIPALNRITVFNVQPVKYVAIDGVKCKSPCNYEYVAQNNTLHVRDANILLSKPFLVEWN